MEEGEIGVKFPGRSKGKKNSYSIETEEYLKDLRKLRFVRLWIKEIYQSFCFVEHSIWVEVKTGT